MSNISLARQTWRDGQVVAACQQVDSLLRREPQHAEGLLLAAEIQLRHGTRAAAEDLAARAMETCSQDPERLLHIAVGVHEIGLQDLARTRFRRILKRKPADRNLRFRWAVMLMVTGHAAEALPEVDDLLKLDPQPELHALRGLTLRHLGRNREAARCFQEALRSDPERMEWWNHLGDLFLDERNLPEAIRAFRNALEATKARNDVPAERVAYALNRLADCFANSNMMDEAWTFSERALSLHDDARARFTDLSLVPVVPTVDLDMARAKQRFLQRLQALEVDLSTAQARSQAISAIKLPFYMHYQGGDQRPMMAMFGSKIAHMVAAWKPDLVQSPSMPATDGRLRIGFVSHMLRRHTITKLFGAWIRGLDRRRFAVHAYHLGPENDEVTAALRAACDGFEHMPTLDSAAVCSRIREDGLHVLIFPELGMATNTYVLAAMRSAPIQLMTWGHPITSGLPTIDGFLTSEAMEPPDGASQYTETLLPLPGLSVMVQPPPAPSARDRSSFGLRDEDVVYLIPQSLFKLQPQDDRRYARIAARVPNARFVFLSHSSATVTALATQRIQEAFRIEGVEVRDRLVVLGQQPWQDYLALNRCADVFLDAARWSGGMTTMEALGMGLVPLTRPGDTMRSRHTAAILGELGLDELIVDSEDSYVDLAVRIGQSSVERARLQERIEVRRRLLYDDPRILPALEQTLEALVRDRTPSAPAHQRNDTPTSGAT